MKYTRFLGGENKPPEIISKGICHEAETENLSRVSKATPFLGSKAIAEHSRLRIDTPTSLPI